MRITASALALLLLPLSLPACGDDDDAPSADAAPGGADAAASDAGTPLLEPPPAGQGVQFQMLNTIAPGVEGEWCQFVQAPAQDMWVNRDEVRFTAGSHHVLLYQTSYTTIPTENDEGVAVDTSGVFDCSAGATAGWSVTKLIGGSQNGTGTSILAFPSDVAMKVEGGTVLLMNAHYLNATEQTLVPEVRVNLWTIPEAQVSQEGDVLFLYNPFIHVPAMGTSRARWRCPVHQDITIANVQSHMHRRGVGYQARVAGEATPFYQNTEWENVPVASFAPGLVVPAGSQLDYHCDYQSSQATDVVQGPRTVNEMCMLIGSYYPADPRTSNCLDATGKLGGEWVGNGTKTCNQTWSCVLGALGAPDAVAALGPCVQDSDPSVAVEMSAAIRCVANNGGLDPCGVEIAACEAK
jgi:hypothetical protein